MVPIMLRRTHRSDPLARVDILLGHSLLEVRPCRTEAERLSAWTDHPHPSAWQSRNGTALSRQRTFFKSKAWTDLGPDRDKAIKTIRRYAVEAVN